MSTDTIQPKAIYEPVTKLEAFYTGGAVRVTRDRKHLACACGDEVKVLDVATGTVAKTLPGDSEPITAVAVSPDCRSLVAASRSLSVKLWDWSSGECRRTWKPHRAPIADLAIDASGGYLASGSADRTIKVTDLAGGYVTHHFTGHGGIVLKVLFHPKQLLLFSACDDGEVRIWDLVTKSCVHTLKGGHISAVPALSLSPDGWHLLSGGRDKVVCVWDIRSGSRVSTVPVFEALEGVAVLPMGSAFPGVAAADAAAAAASSKAGAKKPLVFATAGERGILRIWRSDTGTCVYTHHSSSSGLLQQGPGKGKKSAAAAVDAAAAPGSEFVELLLLPGGKGLMAATGDARLLFYQPQAGAEGPSLQLSRQLIGNHDEVTDLTFLYTGGSSSSSSTTEANEQAAAAAAGGLVLRQGEPRRLAVATNSHDIRLFDLSDASCVGGCIGHKDIVLCLDTVRLSEGVELLASGAKDCEVRVWDPATGGCLAVAAGHVGAVTAVAWSKSKSKTGRYLASGGADKLLKLWDTSKLVAAAAAAAAGAAEQPHQQQQQQLSTIAAVAAHEKDVNALAFSPNDALLASASQDRTIKLWKLPNLVVSHTLRGHKRGVWDLQFSPVDQLLLSCSGDKLVKMWSVAEGTCLRTFEGHTAGVLRCSFLTAGTQVLSAGADGLLKLWDSRTGVNTATFEGHEDRIWGLSASSPPAEALLASGGGDSQIVIWRDATAEKAAEAEAAEESLVLKQQELSNALADGDYAAAAKLAFQLRHPGRLLDVLRRQPGGPTAALAALQSLVGKLSQDELATALGYCREWNTNTRNAHLAQVLLQAVLRSHTPEQILEVPGARELLDGLLAYSQRHSARLDRLMRSTFLLDYTLAASQVLLPENMHDEQQQQGLQQQQQQNGHGLEVNGRSGDDLGSDDFEGWEQQQQDNSDAAADENLGSESEMDEDPIGHDSDAEASPQLKPAAAAAGKRASAAAKAATSAAATAAAAADYVDDGVQLPGWGGGDDLDDGWAADSSEQGGDDSEHGGSDGPDGVSHELGSADAAGSGEGEGSEEDSENGSENDSEPAAAGMGSDDSMGEEGSSEADGQEQPAVLVPVKQRSSGRQAAAAATQQQRGGKQQKEQPQPRGKRQHAAAAAAAVRAQEAGPGKKQKAAAAAAAAGKGSTAAQQVKVAKQRQRATRRA